MDEFEKEIVEDIISKYKEIRPLYKKLLRYWNKKYLKTIPTKLNIPLEDCSIVEALVDGAFAASIENIDIEIQHFKPYLKRRIKRIEKEYKDILREMNK